MCFCRPQLSFHCFRSALFYCKQTCFKSVDWWLWTGSTPVRELRITVVVGGCFVADSAQLLEPHHIPQTDRAGSQSRVRGAEGAGWFELMEIVMGAFFMYVSNISYYIISIRCPLEQKHLAADHFHFIASSAHQPQHQHALHTHVNMSTHTHTVCSHKYANSVWFRHKDTQTLREAVTSLNGPFSPTSP